MPHVPQKFLNKEHAEMMVYALEEHFRRISAVLDAAGVPNDPVDPLTVEQRVKMLAEALACWSGGEPTCWDQLGVPEDVSEIEGEDPEDVAYKIAKLYYTCIGCDAPLADRPDDEIIHDPNGVICLDCSEAACHEAVF